jgi:hypothetical protein
MGIERVVEEQQATGGGEPVAKGRKRGSPPAPQAKEKAGKR